MCIAAVDAGLQTGDARDRRGAGVRAHAVYRHTYIPTYLHTCHTYLRACVHTYIPLSGIGPSFAVTILRGKQATMLFSVGVTNVCCISVVAFPVACFRHQPVTVIQPNVTVHKHGIIFWIYSGIRHHTAKGRGHSWWMMWSTAARFHIQEFVPDFTVQTIHMADLQKSEAGLKPVTKNII